MPEIHNLTDFAARDLPSVDSDGRDVFVVCVAATFVMDAAPRLADEQPAPPIDDIYWGDPAAASLRVEGQTAYIRPGTDIYLDGSAWTPGGHPAVRSHVRVRVGPCCQDAVVTGERRWVRGAGRLHASAPQPFISLPLRHEFSAGGPGDPRNPVGRGHASAREAEDRPLPAIEAADALVERWSDRPAPVGFGPIARHWQPRREFAGTYDEAWISGRAPLWPRDFDPRFFNAAAPGLIADPGLVGGELVCLEGVNPDGTITFELPTFRLRATLQTRVGRRRQSLRLDAVALAPEIRRFTMIWRTAFAVPGDWLDLESAVVRTLEPWEADRA